MRRGREANIPRRRGLATLETALALPVLALVAAVIFAVARGGIARLQGTQEVRQKAWKQRHGSAPGGRLVIRPSQADLLHEEFTHLVKGPPAMSGIGDTTMRARHAVFAGSLDYHDIPLNHPPELDFVRNMAGMIQAPNKDDLDGLLAGLTGAQLSADFSQLDNVKADFQTKIDQANQNWQQKRQELEQQRQKLRAQLLPAQQKVQTLSNGVSGLNKRITDLQQQRKQAEGIKDKVKQKQALDNIDRQLKPLQAQDNTEKKQLNAAMKELQRLRYAEEVDKFHP